MNNMPLIDCRTQLIGHNSETAGQIKKCIDDWINAGSVKGQAFAVAGSNLTVYASNHNSTFMCIMTSIRQILTIL